MTKLLRNGVLVAEGRATVDLDCGVILFEVRVWHMTAGDACAWEELAAWSLRDARRVRELPGKANVVGLQRDGTLATLDLSCTSVAGPLTIDVRDDPDA